MKRLIATLTLGSCFFAAVHAGTVRVITDRTETHLKPLFSLFEKNTGIKVEAIYVDKGMMARVTSRPKEADVVISKTADNLEILRQKNALRKIESDVLATINPVFVDPDQMYVVTSYRPRTFFYSKERVNPEELSTYADLADPKWKGKISIRSGYHSYNMSLFCQLMAKEGPEKTRAFIEGLKKNQARLPQGNDRAQVKAIYEEKADLSVGNSYYMGLMLARDDQRAWGESTGVFFPNQKEEGAYVMSSGAGLTVADRNVEDATKLLEYLLSDFSQFYFSTKLHVYAVKEGIPVSELNKDLGKNQEEIKEGEFKARIVPIREIAKHREAVTKILNDVKFDH